jgi:hypothetical protein
VDKSYTDYFLLTDMGTISGRFTRGSSLSLEKAQREIAGDRQARYSVAGGPPTTGDFTDVSNFGFASTYIESFGGTKEGDSQFFDALNQIGDRHLLVGIDRWLSLRGNNTQAGGMGSVGGPSAETPPGADIMPTQPPEKGKLAGGPEPVIEGTECPACCFDFFVPNCVSEFGEITRQCWHIWCCRCADWSTVGVYPCDDPNNQCVEKCCNETVYSKLETGRFSDPTKGIGTLCGGTGGGCWWGLMYLIHADYWWRKRIVEFIERMCREINETRCLGLCANQQGLCACIKGFCNCDLLIEFYVDEGRFIPEWKPGGGQFGYDRIILGSGATWRDIFHEMMHECQYRAGWGAYAGNLESVAYACERICEGIEYAGKGEWEHVDPCCCSDRPPDRCLGFWRRIMQEGVRGSSGWLPPLGPIQPPAA